MGRKIKYIEIVVKHTNGDYRMVVLSPDDIFPVKEFHEKVIDLMVEVADDCRKNKVKNNVDNKILETHE